MNIHTVLDVFSPISLSEMDAVELLDRTDTKYVFHSNMFAAVLKNIGSYYFILEVNGMRTCRYESLYYDSENFALYTMHHNGKGNRLKVRYRHYETTDKYFFEVKRKTNKGRTVKKRLTCNALESTMPVDKAEFLKKWSAFDPGHLIPSVQTDFTRITLVSKDFTERVTFDYDLNFIYNNAEKKLDDLIIAEVKQSKYNYNSPVIKFLKQQHIFPRSISKYCLGVIQMSGSVKKNLFKKQLHEIHHLLNKTQHYEY